MENYERDEKARKREITTEEHGIEPSKGQFLVYQAEDGELKPDVRFEDESVRLTQQLPAELFQSSKQNVSHHINAIYEEEELLPEATVKKYLTVRQEGNREVKRLLDYYNLDMIISVGYRSKRCVKRILGPTRPGRKTMIVSLNRTAAI